MSNAYRQAASAYSAGAALASDPSRVMWLLHDGIGRDIGSAKLAYERGDLQQCCRHLEHANKILAGLLTHLRFETAGAAGLALSAAYFSAARRLARVLFDANVAETLQECATLFQTLRDARSLSETSAIDATTLISA